MNPAHKPLLWGGALIVVGALAVIALRGISGGGDAPAPATHTAPAQEPAAAAAVAPSSADEPMPWMQGEGAPAGGTAIARAAAGNAPQAVAQAEIDRSLADIRQKSEHNIRAADDMLAQLDALEKSGKVPPDLRLDALRNNLIIAKRAQSLARELAESTQLPDSPQRRQRNAEIVAELQQLQGQLRYDVAPAGLPIAADRTR
ncbi:hypothetical protein CQ393_14700 [Stenotrophomonas sp. MYb238]|uniref:hypothetical protein n=1 Tax=Stenotrophomonas sp. MYb238 TaxID=2040281 RepID=UPI001291D7BC|nr:hypothetical protein [Stenotrophomonas sp. MYb238]MQP77130.1 hypothetical protein [Stenotrophomonas sp. MYb238]